MDAQRSLKQRSLEGLIRVLVTNRSLRKKVTKMIRDKLYAVLVEENVDNRPRRVQEEKHAYLMALLGTCDRAIERGLISKPVVNRLIDVFLNNVVLNKARRTISAPLGVVPPMLLVVSPTGRCNLRCTGCYAASDPSNHGSLNFETFDRILREKRDLWGSHFTVISGGEPFLWKDGQHDLLSMVARYPSELFMVYTNSTLISDDVARRMAELGNITPAISVEGFEEETDARRGTGVHRRILAAFENLRRYGVPFGISATPTKDNWEIITSDRFVDFYFQQEGAIYGWLFQYMPIGRGQSLRMMVSPEQRLEMLKRLERVVRERQVFLADFWNSGPVSNGCICAGRPGGYFYIDWNGDVSPCVFVPYSTDNIVTIYRNGGTLNTVLESPLFQRIRAWQDGYGYARSPNCVHNWLSPCVIRDHFEMLKEAVDETNARPVNEEAAIALRDDAYCRGMARYGKDYRSLSDEVWTTRYVQGAPEEVACVESA